jgi:DNA-binding beta-propeller fold protein YncE
MRTGRQGLYSIASGPARHRKRFWPHVRTGLTVLVPIILAAIPAKADNIFVTYAGAENTVQEYASGSVGSPTYNGTTFTTTNLANDNGLAIDASGNVYVANVNNGSITEYTPGGGNPGGLTNNVFASGLNSPNGLAFDAYGDLYVANSGAGNIIKITPSGTQSIFATGIGDPTQMAFDSNGNLFVSNGSGNYSVDEVSPTGTVTIFAAANSTGNVTGIGYGDLNDPQGLAIDASGNVYVANGNSDDNIVELTPSGAASVFATEPAGSSPHGLAFDSSGDLWVVNNGHPGYGENDSPSLGFSTVEEFAPDSGSPTNTPINIVNDNTASPSGLEDGAAIAIESNNGSPLLGAIPEPSTAGVFAIGAASLIGFSRFRSRRRS